MIEVSLIICALRFSAYLINNVIVASEQVNKPIVAIERQKYVKSWQDCKAKISITCQGIPELIKFLLEWLKVA